MTARTRAVVVVGLTALLVVLAVVAAIISLGVPTHEQTRVAQLVYLTGPLWFGVTGGLLVLQRPANVIAWALWVIGFASLSSTFTEALLNRHLTGRRVPGSLLGWAAWLDNWTWVFTFAPIVILLLRFPNGRLSGPWWRRLENLVLGTSSFALVMLASASSNEDYPGVRIPVRLGPLSQLPPTAAAIGTGVGFLTAVVAFVAAAGGLLVRFRGSHGVERAQLQWLMFAAGVFASAFVLVLSISAGYGGRERIPAMVLPVYDLLAQVTVPLIPVAIGIAVTRHGLFEIDRLVSRTVSYAVVVALLAGAYVVVVAGVSALVPDRFGSVAVVLATLSVSALFVPVRRRVVRVVDRRFNRSRYDAAQEISTFAERVRGRAGQGTTGDELLAAAQRVLQPAHASVWLAPRGGS